MSMCTSFGMMLRGDIKHTHYGRATRFQYRAETEYPNQSQMNRMDSDSSLKQHVLASRTNAYRTNPVPPAPAFRVISRHNLDELVQRLTKPTVASSLPKICNVKPDVDESLIIGAKPLEGEGNEALTERLSRPTHVSKIRTFRDPVKVIQLNNKELGKGSGVTTVDC